MQRGWLLALAVFLLIAAVVAITLSRQSAAPSDTGSAWKSYTDADTGFTISYPSQYAVDAHEVASGTPWGSHTLLNIYDPSATPSGEFGIGPASVVLVKQPTEADGKIYHEVADYDQSGAADRSIQGISPPKGKRLTVGGKEALFYHFPPGDASDASVDEYVFIHDDLIYRVSLDAADPGAQRMLASIAWR
ncbi:MAG TPA: hypothetical protein VG889_18760 [Rhizomicrobium sp.]|nr:hypothetical protein [Rhizomicrobium sp.]